MLFGGILAALGLRKSDPLGQDLPWSGPSLDVKYEFKVLRPDLACRVKDSRAPERYNRLLTIDEIIEDQLTAWENAGMNVKRTGKKFS